MNRRKSIKTLLVGSASTGLLLDACKPGEGGSAQSAAGDKGTAAGPMNINRMAEETAEYNRINGQVFFTPAEMTTLTILAEIIIPRDELSAGATDAKVPDFIEFIVKDKPEYQTPMRGGLRWLDLQCLKKFERSFADCNRSQQMEMVDAIAWPQKAAPAMHQGVTFFSLMRNLTASGFYTSPIGQADLGYIGNRPNQWNGVPDEVLKQYNLQYSQKELRECVSFG